MTIFLILVGIDSAIHLYHVMRNPVCRLMISVRIGSYQLTIGIGPWLCVIPLSCRHLYYCEPPPQSQAGSGKRSVASFRSEYLGG